MPAARKVARQKTVTVIIIIRVVDKAAERIDVLARSFALPYVVKIVKPSVQDEVEPCCDRLRRVADHVFLERFVGEIVVRGSRDFFRLFEIGFISRDAVQIDRPRKRGTRVVSERFGLVLAVGIVCVFHARLFPRCNVITLIIVKKVIRFFQVLDRIIVYLLREHEVIIGFFHRFRYDLVLFVLILVFDGLVAVFVHFIQPHQRGYDRAVRAGMPGLVPRSPQNTAVFVAVFVERAVPAGKAVVCQVFCFFEVLFFARQIITFKHFAQKPHLVVVDVQRAFHARLIAGDVGTVHPVNGALFRPREFHECARAAVPGELFVQIVHQLLIFFALIRPLVQRVHAVRQRVDGGIMPYARPAFPALVFMGIPVVDKQFPIRIVAVERVQILIYIFFEHVVGKLRGTGGGCIHRIRAVFRSIAAGSHRQAHAAA